jgi:hypothetical protein
MMPMPAYDTESVVVTLQYQYERSNGTRNVTNTPTRIYTHVSCRLALSIQPFLDSIM